jgi:hypothetical protein
MPRRCRRVVLCRAVMGCNGLCRAVPCCAVLCRAVLCRAVSCRATDTNAVPLAVAPPQAAAPDEEEVADIVAMGDAGGRVHFVSLPRELQMAALF